MLELIIYLLIRECFLYFYFIILNGVSILKKLVTFIFKKKSGIQIKI